MWKTRKEEETPINPPKEVSPVATPIERKAFEPERETSVRTGIAHIGKSVVVKGELSGSEDLYIDGEVEGTVELRDHNLTIGPNGRVKANLNAKEVTILGKVQGNVRATDRVDIRKPASLIGDIAAARINIEDGAYIKGSIDIQKPEAGRVETRKVEVAAAAAPSSFAALGVEKKLS